jgi:AraC-like DNA-binding protein
MNGTDYTYIYQPLENYSISAIEDLEKADTVDQAHQSYKIVVSLDHALACIIQGEAVSNLQGFLLNQSVIHTYTNVSSKVLVNFIEADSYLGWQLGSLLNGKPWININSVLSTEQYKNILPPDYARLSNEEILPFVHDFLSSIFSAVNPKNRIISDQKLIQALQFIDNNLQTPPELEEVAKQAGLPTERFRHLFIKQMHIPFSRYILWKQIKNNFPVSAAREQESAPFTHYGFGDQAHYFRTFKDLFGLLPTEFQSACRILL